VGRRIAIVKRRAVSFAPVSDGNARVLILGSMPGEVSLSAGEYYAHPRNAFWRIIAALTGIEPHADYEARLAALRDSHIAVWDVLRSCHRRGSLDAAIELDSIEVNDFDAFFTVHPLLEAVLFNGAAAERCYLRRVKPHQQHRNFRYSRLPSTSPAHASLTFDAKLALWRATIGDQIAASPRQELP
jgi:TDG/mug DNA glycosylase family protein